MENPKIVKVTNKGMITIPAEYRKKFNIHDGDQIAVVEDENGLRLIQVELIENLRKKSVSAKELQKIMTEARKTELELEF
jgi:AbrB family looped-hinge helix DNA binding protein